MRPCWSGFHCRLFFSALVVSIAIAGCGGYSPGTNHPATLSITTAAALPTGTVGSAYAMTFAAAGGTSPYTWSVSAGALPAGLALSGAGVLSGTPTMPGNGAFTVQAKDSASSPQTATLAATLTVHDSAVTVTTAGLPLANDNAAYSATLTASGGVPPYTWSLIAGALPSGVSLSPAGVLSGTPAAAGVFKFTAQASDSYSTPQSGSAALQLLVSSGALAVATSSLPAGQQSAAYPSTQLAATGGVPPYTWSIGTGAALPPGLTLSSSGVLSGTPTGVSDISPQFIVTDAANETASKSLKLLIVPAPGAIPDGQYSFTFSGTAPQGTPPSPSAFAIAGTFSIKSNVIQSGYYDENTNTDPTPASQRVPSAITGGSLTNGGDGLGTLVLNTGANGTLTFALATPPSVTTGASSNIRMIEFDDSTGKGSRGSGILQPASLNPSASAISGNFSFLFSGTDLNQREQALIGSFQTDGAGNLTSGHANSNQAGELVDFTIGSGTYAVDANGRGLLRINLGSGSFDFSFAFYQVTSGEWLVVSLDPATLNSPLVTGSVLQQTGGPFSAASLPATSVLEISGLKPVSAGTTVPDITLGQAASDGKGNITYTFDEYNGTLAIGQSFSVTYAVDPVTGRAVSTGATPQPILYLINGTSAFLLGPDQSTSSGIIEAQTGSSFTASSFNGDYLGGSLPQENVSVLNESGIVAADGSGNVLFTTNRSTSQGLVLYQNIAGSYTVDSTGRVVVTTPDGLTRIFYVVSPTKVAYLTSDTGGYLGSFEQ